MNDQRFFSGILLIGFGLYFFLQHSAFTWLQPYLGWPALLFLIGLAFLLQGYKSDGIGILPGVILSGFGLHFYVVSHLGWWANNTGVLLLLISIGFLLQSAKNGFGLAYGILFLVLAVVTLFYGTIYTQLGSFRFLWQFWPLLLVILGGYLLFVQKSRKAASRK